jgi:hypothetical protein
MGNEGVAAGGGGERLGQRWSPKRVREKKKEKKERKKKTHGAI